MMRLLRPAIWCLLFFAADAGVCTAHPLGNFTINHLARVTVSERTVRVHYVLDIAEIPSFQIMHDPSWGGTGMQWAQSERDVVLRSLQLQAGGSALPLRPTADPAHVELRPGAGGLPILYWTSDFEAPLRAADTHVTVSDRVYAERRIGWKDIVVGTETEPTHALRSYPSDLIGTPRRISGVQFGVRGDSIVEVTKLTDDSAQLSSTPSMFVRQTALSDMLSRREQSAGFVLLTVLLAFALGALHALEPGHGKALLAFTLVGSRATVRQAAILAGSLTFAHTIGVVILGLVLFSAANFVSETVYPWITLVSGGAVAAIGSVSLGRAIRARFPITHVHTHTHDGAHPHAHEHDADHGHSHAIPGEQPLNFRSAVVAAMSGGIAPCPAAIVVLLAALRLHEVGYGLFLIVVFSLGLAAVLTGLGIGVVRGAAWLSQRSGYQRIANLGPTITATVISIAGSIMVGQGFVQTGLAPNVVIIALIAFAAIIGYALTRITHTHTHAVEKVQA